MAITKITVINDDGTTTEFFPQVTPVTVNEVDVVSSDGSTKKFVPDAPTP